MNSASHHRFDAERFARDVRSCRAALLLELRDVAKLVGGVAPSTIHRVEHGYSIPGPGLFMALCRWMDSSPWRYYIPPADDEVPV